MHASFASAKGLGLDGSIDVDIRTCGDCWECAVFCCLWLYYCSLSHAIPFVISNKYISALTQPSRIHICSLVICKDNIIATQDDMYAASCPDCACLHYCLHAWYVSSWYLYVFTCMHIRTYMFPRTCWCSSVHIRQAQLARCWSRQSQLQQFKTIGPLADLQVMTAAACTYKQLSLYLFQKQIHTSSIFEMMIHPCFLNHSQTCHTMAGSALSVCCTSAGVSMCPQASKVITTSLMTIYYHLQ